MLSRTALHFVRCVKPNAAQVPSTFDASLVLHQLRCCGVLEVTRIARAGYPTRYLHQEFADRYGILLTPKARGKSCHTNPVTPIQCPRSMTHKHASWRVYQLPASVLVLVRVAECFVLMLRCSVAESY